MEGVTPGDDGVETGEHQSGRCFDGSRATGCRYNGTGLNQRVARSRGSDVHIYLN